MSLNYHDYARTADYTRAAALIERAVSTMPQASEDWKNRVLADTKKNVGGITRVKKGE